MDLEEVGLRCVKYSYLISDREKWRGVAKTVTNHTYLLTYLRT